MALKPKVDSPGLTSGGSFGSKNAKKKDEEEQVIRGGSNRKSAAGSATPARSGASNLTSSGSIAPSSTRQTRLAAPVPAAPVAAPTVPSFNDPAYQSQGSIFVPQEEEEQELPFWHPGAQTRQAAPQPSGPQQIATYQPTQFERSGINLAGLVDPTGLPVLDHLLGISAPPQEEEPTEQLDLMGRLGQRWDQTQEAFGQAKEWYNANPNIQYAEDMAQRRANDLASGEQGDTAMKWRAVGIALSQSGFPIGRAIGPVIEWFNRPENLEPRNKVLNVVDHVSEMGLIPATTPVRTILNMDMGAEAYSQPNQGPSIASAITPLGAAFNRAFNPLNPNRNQALWGTEKQAETASQQVLDAVLPGTPDDAEEIVNRALARFGVTVNLEMPEADTLVGRIVNSMVWVAGDAAMEYEKIDEAVETISKGAQVDPQLGMFKRLVWSGGDKMLNGYNQSMNRQQNLNDMGEEFEAAQAAGDWDRAALIYDAMQELQGMSNSGIMEENMNIWAEVLAGVAFDVGLLGAGGDLLGDGVRGINLALRTRRANKVYNITEAMAKTNIDLALSNSRQLLTKMQGAGTPKELRDAWLGLTRPLKKGMEGIVDRTGLFALTKRSQADLDADTLLRGLRWILKDIDTKEDAVKVLATLTGNRPDDLIKGIGGLTSQKVRSVSPTGVMQWGPGVVGNSPFTRRMPILKMARGAVLSLPSLVGTGKLEGEKFFSELAGVVSDFARTVNGITETPGVVEGGFNLLRAPFELQKRIMSDSWLALRPANWVRNATSGTGMLIAEDMWGTTRLRDIDDYFMNKIGTANVLEGTNDLAQGARREVSGFWGPLAEKLLGKRNPITPITEAGYKIAYGRAWAGAEGSMRAQGAYQATNKALRTGWQSEVNQIAQTLAQVGLPPQTVNNFVAGLYEAGVHGNKQDVMAYVQNFANTGTFKVSMTAMGLPDDVLTIKTYKAIQQALQTGDPGQWQVVRRQIKQAIASQRRQPLDSLMENPKQVGDFKWLKQQVPDQAQKIADLQRRYALRAGATPQAATAKSQQTAEQFLASHATAFDGFRNALRQAPNTPNSWAVTADYYNEYQKLLTSANKQVDDLSRQAQYTNDWDYRDQQVAAIYAQFNKNLGSLSRKYQTVLRKSAMGTPYKPVTRGWGQVMEQQALFDEQWFKQFHNYKVADVADPQYGEKIRAWRAYVDNATAEMFEAFRLFPSLDNLDVISQTLDDVAKLGRSAAQRAEQYREARRAGKLSKKGYYDRSNALWEQQFGLAAGQAASTARAIIAHSLMTNTSDTLRFTVGQKEFMLAAPKGQGLWQAINTKTGKGTLFAEPGVRSRRPKLPQGIIDEYNRLTGQRAGQIGKVGATVTQAAQAAAPKPSNVPPPRVNTVAPGSLPTPQVFSTPTKGSGIMPVVPGTVAPGARPAPTPGVFQVPPKPGASAGASPVSPAPGAGTKSTPSTGPKSNPADLDAVVEGDVVHIRDADGSWRAVPVRELERQAKGKARKGKAPFTPKMPPSPYTGVPKKGQSLDPTAGMSHEQAWNLYGDILSQYGWTKRQLQNLSEDEFRWAVQSAAEQKPPLYPRGVPGDRLVDRPELPPPSTPDLEPWRFESEADLEEFGYNQVRGESLGRFEIRPEDMEEFGYNQGMVKSPERVLTRDQEEFGPSRWPDRLDYDDEMDVPGKWSSFVPERTTPHNVWTPGKFRKKAGWKAAEDVAFYDENQLYLRMTLPGGAKLLPPGVESLMGTGGHWRKVGADLHYILPVQEEELVQTADGIRKRAPDLLRDYEDLLTGKAPDNQGRLWEDPDYEFWYRDQPNTAPQEIDLYPAGPTDGSAVIPVGGKTKLEEVAKSLRPEKPQAFFDDLTERWRLPAPIDRSARVRANKVDADTTEFMFARLPKGAQDVRLLADVRDNGYYVTHADGRLASQTRHPNLKAAEAEARILMVEGIGVDGGGIVVRGKGMRRRVPEGIAPAGAKVATPDSIEGMTPKQVMALAKRNEALRQASSRDYLKGKSPQEILEFKFEDAEGKVASGRDLLRMSGFSKEEIAAWVSDPQNGRAKILAAVEASLGMRSPVPLEADDLYFHGGLPVPPEVLAFFRDTWDAAIRRWGGNIASGMAFSQSHAPYRGISLADLKLHEMSSLDEIEDALTDPATLQSVLAGIHQQLGGAARSQLMNLAQNAGQRYDNALASSLSLAEAAVNWAMLDFRKQRNIDAMFGFLAPFSFFVTRMPGRAAMAALKKPSFLGAYYDLDRGISLENQQTGVPKRFEGTLPVPGTDKRVQVRRFLTDLVPGMMYMASDTFFRPEDIENDGDALLYALEQSTPLGPLQKLLLDYAMDGEVREGITLGSMVPQWRMFKYAQQGISGQLEKPGPWMGGTDYDAGIVGRNISANLGVGTDTEGYAQAAAAYSRAGVQPPEGAIPQEAQDLFTREAKETGWEMFWRTVSGYVMSPVSVYTEEEAQQQAMVQQRRDIRYDGGKNPAGSRTAVRQFDERTGNEARDFMGYVQLYEDGTPEQALASAQNRDLRMQTDAIHNKYDLIEEEYFASHPNLTEDEYYAFVEPLNAQRYAEIDAAKASLPGAAEYEFTGDADSRYAAENPEELQLAAMEEAQRQAEAELIEQGIAEPPYLENPTSWEEARVNAAERNEWKAQVDRIAQAKVDDPEWVRTTLGDRDPVTGAKIPTAAEAQAAASRQPQGSRPVPPGFGPSLGPGAPRRQIYEEQAPSVFTPDPNNPYADKMAEQEELYGLPSGLLQAVARHESGFDPEASSGAAHGLMQFTPATWGDMERALGVTDIWDPEQSIEASAYYLDSLNDQLPPDKKNNVAWIVAAYNVGPGNVQKMTKLEDILDPNIIEWGDREARYQYALDIAAEVGAVASARPAQAQNVTAVVEDPANTQQMFIRPIVGGADKVSQGYGANVANYAQWNEEHGHEGVDYGVPVGTPVVASGAGTVAFAGTGGGFGNYGNYVIIDHGNGYKSYYAHLDGFDVQPGDVVEQGQQIALSGNSGRSTGPHLHFSIRSDSETDHPYGMIDPTDYILGREGVTPVASAPVEGNEVQVAAQPANKVPGRSAPAVQQVPGAPQMPDVQIKNPTSQVTMPGVQIKSPVTGNSIPTTMEEYRAFEKTSRATPSEAAVLGNIKQGKADARAYMEELYPEYAGMYDEYKALVYDADRAAYAERYPEVRAVNLAMNNPREFREMTERFGPGAGMLYARTPKSPFYGGEQYARKEYYAQNPDAFLVNAWVTGRPQVDDKNDNPMSIEPKNWGKDYQKAEEMFGTGIWEIVKAFQSVPYGDAPEAKAARRAFYEANPVYNQWADWWYGLLPDTQAPFGQYGGFGRGSRGGGSSGFQRDTYVEPLEEVRVRGFELARARRSGVEQGGWRKWIALGEQ